MAGAGSQGLTGQDSICGKYEFTKMPFGLVSAQATFQRYVNTTLAEYSDFAEAYIDDVVIFSDTWEDHVRHIHTILRKLG